MNPQDFDVFHAHVYFDASTRPKAAKLQADMLQRYGRVARVSRLVDRPIGPHPVPMFEIDFASSMYDEVVNYIDGARDGLSVLVHPESPEEVLDHTVRARWLGEKLVLDIGFLEDFMAGRVGSVRSGLR